ncbi:MAG TPA: NifB/NifX family molybdenum-iron cluster-binding protein [Stenomitos sp.]
MKIAVSSQNQTTVTGHAGHCLKFWIYNVDTPDESRQLLELSKDQSFHATPPQKPHPLDDVQVLISGSMGSGLAHRLEAKGIKPIVTPETDPDAAVAAYLVGSLVLGAPEDHDHTHEHEDGHEQEGKCGCSSGV